MFLAAYGLRTGLINEEDVIFTVNALLKEMGMDSFEGSEEDVIRASCEISEEEIENGSFLETVLKRLTDEAVKSGKCAGDSVVFRDLFDTALMGAMTARPSEVIRTFRDIVRDKGPEAATDWYYSFSRNTDYIRRYRVRRDMKWKTTTEYGDLDITINLSKPEKDPKAIAAAGKAKSVSYPKCQLCLENEGYAGRADHPARENHRIIPVTIQGTRWGFQYSPYVYYNEHCIVFNGKHTPMRIDHNAFCKLFDFVKQFPHYFVGSNADLPIVGGSILSHDHFQGGRYEFPMAKAPVEETFVMPGFEDIESGIVRWPMSVIRLSGKDTDRIIELADRILAAWRGYTDESAQIFAETDGVPHNTITPIARKRGENFELDLVLRNNLTTEEHPLGVYHPHSEYHHSKKENIGLIEVMGLAVLPARLREEMELLKEQLLRGDTDEMIRANEKTEKHADWVGQIREKHADISGDNVMEILKQETGEVFLHVLENAGVYKRTEEGRRAFLRFVKSVR
ncbi:MAG: UDP-glucose--hexose-1-phosphate uridylyltransferase [Stomatobaculum sp.]|nr:UDP-glucose--hexose-1-phosphate uridylyltransferase [Stomatobaculum sp.]